MGIEENTLSYGGVEVPLYRRPWPRIAERLPYRKTYLLKPGDDWRDAPVSSKIWEHYAIGSDGPVPVGSKIAAELMKSGAIEAYFTECFGRGRVVFVRPDLICAEPSPNFVAVLADLYRRNDRRWAGLPDVIARLADGTFDFIDAKVAKRDRLSLTQHAFARRTREALGSLARFSVVEWGSETVRLSPAPAR